MNIQFYKKVSLGPYTIVRILSDSNIPSEAASGGPCATVIVIVWWSGV